MKFLAFIFFYSLSCFAENSNIKTLDFPGFKTLVQGAKLSGVVRFKDEIWVSVNYVSRSNYNYNRNYYEDNRLFVVFKLTKDNLLEPVKDFPLAQAGYLYTDSNKLLLALIENPTQEGQKAGLYKYADGKWKRIFGKAIMPLDLHEKSILAKHDGNLLMSVDEGKSWQCILQDHSVIDAFRMEDKVYFLNHQAQLHEYDLKQEKIEKLGSSGFLQLYTDRKTGILGWGNGGLEFYSFAQRVTKPFEQKSNPLYLPWAFSSYQFAMVPEVREKPLFSDSGFRKLYQVFFTEKEVTLMPVENMLITSGTLVASVKSLFGSYSFITSDGKILVLSIPVKAFFKINGSGHLRVTYDEDTFKISRTVKSHHDFYTETNLVVEAIPDEGHSIASVNGLQLDKNNKGQLKITKDFEIEVEFKKN